MGLWFLNSILCVLWIVSYGGFFLVLRGFLREWSNIHSRLRFFFFFEVEISSRTLIPLFVPGSVHSGSANWDDYGQMFPDKLRASSFPDRFPHGIVYGLLVLYYIALWLWTLHGRCCSLWMEVSHVVARSLTWWYGLWIVSCLVLGFHGSWIVFNVVLRSFG